METIINNLNSLKHTAIDNFELNSINTAIKLINQNKLDKLIKEIDHEIDNYQQYINFMFFTELKKAITNN